MEIDALQLPEDKKSLYEICALTVREGGGTGSLLTDSRLPGDIFAVPYIEYDPSLCLILRGQSGPMGYALGAAQSVSFAAWFSRQWAPELHRRYTSVLESPASAFEEGLLDHINKDMEVLDFVREYPARMYIEILPEGRGKGYGKRLMNAYLDLLAGRDLNGVYLEVGEKNIRGIEFCRRMGFSLIAWKPGTRYMGLKLIP